MSRVKKGNESLRILFVCTANVSRSYLAEMIMRHRLKENGLSHVEVLSRGIYAFPGSPPDPEMVRFLEDQGISPGEHKSEQLKEQDIKDADIICVMERGHKSILEGLFPSARGKVRLLSSFIKFGDNDDIPDPVGRSPYHYRLAQAQISMAVDGMIEFLKGRR